MARLSLMNDISALICLKYINGEYDENTNQNIWNVVHDIIWDITETKQFIWEIAYRIGYAKSAFMSNMSETTYKKRKQKIRHELLMRIDYW